MVKLSTQKQRMLLVRKMLFLLFMSVLIFIGFQSNVSAEDFSFEYEITNTVKADMTLTTDYHVTVTNHVGNNYIGKTKITYPLDPDIILATNTAGGLNTQKDKDGDNYVISVSHKPVLGVGSKFSYTLSLTTKHAIQKKGNVLDIYIPGFIESDSHKVKKNYIKIAKNLPSVKYSSKVLNFADLKDTSYNSYEVSNPSGLNIIAAEKSKYKFSLLFAPQNDIVYIPTNSLKQKVIVSNIRPTPTDTLIDNEQNIALSFDKNIKTVNLEGEVEIETDKYSAAPEPDLPADKTFWKYDVRLDTIVSEVKQKSNVTAKVKSALDYIATNTKYDVKTLELNRLETKELLDSKDRLNSLNIADLTITILKYSGVDAKLVGGFVDNQIDTQFTRQGLHFWVEYYDPTYQGWRSSDPTLYLISPNDNYYDSIGLSHIEIFHTRTGFNIPVSNVYKFTATLTEGTLTPTEIVTAELKTKEVQSGREKTIEVIIKNMGNSISVVKDINISINNAIENTTVGKVLFPNQQIVIDAKIKNDNYYEENTLSTKIDVITDKNTYTNETNLTFQKSSYALLIAGGIIFILIVIILAVLLLARKNSKKIR